MLLPRSCCEGMPVRVHLDLRHVLRSVELGLLAWDVDSPDRPVVAREGRRLLLAMPLSSQQALGPLDDSLKLSPSDERESKSARRRPRPVAMTAQSSPAEAAVATPATAYCP